MTRYCATFVFVFSISLLCIPAGRAQSKGLILGTVIDENGAPVVGAKVNARPVVGGRIIKRSEETDATGNFTVDGLEFGKYGLFVMKEEAQYPDMSLSFYSDNVFPVVTINPGAPIATVRVQLGPKAGVISGSVTSAVSGAPLNAAFKLTREASPNEWLGTSAPPNYRILLPASTNVLLEVSAPGFKTWRPGQALRLQPSQELKLDILLEPSNDPDLHPSTFLVPEGYVGWLLLDYEVNGAPAVPVEAGINVYRFSSSGALTTSSPGPQRGAEDQYLYYSANGSSREIPTDYRNGRGMIWGQYEGTRNGRLSQFGFFVGSEEQYKKFQNRKTHPGPIPAH